MIVKPQIVRDTGDYLVRFHYLDIENGELVNKIVERYVNAGDTVVAPGIPTSLSAITKKSCALTFTSWNHTDFTNIQRDLDVGAIYDTTDAKTHVLVTITATSGLALPVSYTKSDSSTLTISWGDGSSDDNVTSSGSTTHTYANEGIYEITLWISSGAGTFSLGYNSKYFIGNTSDTFFKCTNSLFIGNKVTAINATALYYSSMKILTIPNSVTTLGASSINSSELTALSLPTSITILPESAFGGSRNLQFISLPDTITSTTTRFALMSLYSLKSIVLPSSLATINNSDFGYLYLLEKITFPSNITTLPINCVTDCYNLKTINMSNNVTTISSSAFYSCYSLTNIILSNSLTTFSGTYTFRNCYSLKNIILPSGLTNIVSGCFYNCPALQTLTLRRFTAPNTITILDDISALYYTAKTLRIYVPVGSGDVYKNATNWSTYANQIYEDTPENRAIFGD